MNVKFGFSLQGRGLLADRESITMLARRADALGYDSVWVTDRLLIPVESRSPGVQHFVFDFSVGTVPEMLLVLERFAAEVRPHVQS
jgi:alkanesulfonate monooxygenase SsuD/methylene tetrahydromethanopterin reductase-like flavin-dependent oxidoreductase (luciferase family)